MNTYLEISNRVTKASCCINEYMSVISVNKICNCIHGQYFLHGINICVFRAYTYRSYSSQNSILFIAFAMAKILLSTYSSHVLTWRRAMTWLEISIEYYFSERLRVISFPINVFCFHDGHSYFCLCIVWVCDQSCPHYSLKLPCTATMLSNLEVAI